MPWPKPRTDDRPTQREDLTDFQEWARKASASPEGAIPPYVRRRLCPNESGTMPAYEPREPAKEQPRPRFPSGALFNALKVKS